MRVFPLLAQKAALANAEAVLFVDDPQPQPTELDPLLEDGMSADHQVDASVADLLQHFRLFPGRSRTGEQNRAQAELRQPVTELQVVLFCQDFGWSDHCHLGIVLDGQQSGHEGNDRFAAPHVPLHQTVHRMGRHQILLDLPQHPALGIGQTIREHLRQRPGIAVGNLKREALLEHHPTPSEGKAKLQEEKLVVNQSTPGLVTSPFQIDRRDITRPVHLLQGG